MRGARLSKRCGSFFDAGDDIIFKRSTAPCYDALGKTLIVYSLLVLSGTVAAV